MELQAMLYQEVFILIVVMDQQKNKFLLQMEGMGVVIKKYL